MEFKRTWTDQQLVDAVELNHSWRAVLRALGLGPGSSLAIVQRRVVELNLDTSHFRGKRAWADEALVEAIPTCHSWSAVARRLGAGTDKQTFATMEAIAVQHRVDTSHLRKRNGKPTLPPPRLPGPNFANFGVEAEFLAAAWFVSRGFRVSLAGPGLPYDLIIDDRTTLQRVQVKSTTATPNGVGAVDVKLSRLSPSAGAARNRRQQPYAAGDFDLFFVLTSEGHVYLVPLEAVLGQIRAALGPQSPYFVQTMGLSGR